MSSDRADSGVGRLVGEVGCGPSVGLVAPECIREQGALSMCMCMPLGSGRDRALSV